MTKPPPSDEFARPSKKVLPADAPALADRAQSLETLRDLAAFHLTYGQIANAERLLQIALWINPKDGRSQRLQAHALARRGAPMEAARLLVSAAKSRDTKLGLGDWKEVGLALLRQGHKPLGMKFLTRRQNDSVTTKV